MGIIRKIFSPKNQYMLLDVQEQEKKDKSVRLGVQGIILSVVGMVLVVALVYLGTLCAANMMGTQLGDEAVSFPVLSLLGVIVFYFLAFLCVFSVLDGISFAVFQRKLNKRGIGIANLIISLVCLVITVGAVIAILVVML